MKIPLNKPSLVGNEVAYIKRALKMGHLSGDGYYTRQCSQFLEKRLLLSKVLLTSSCTHALELAALLIDIEPGDEVILPSFTFPSTANAFALRGAKPRFVDVRSDTFNMDEKLIEAQISSRTRAIVPVHYAGVPCDMDAILQIARRHHLPVIEDAAQALGATFRGRPAGTFGILNAFSFHETKNCSCGEGGALAVTDASYIQRAEIIRQKGTNRAQFYRREIDKYSWVDVGSSYVPSELQSAYLFAQLQKMEEIKKKRKKLYFNYLEALKRFEEKGHIQLPFIPDACESSYHLFYILCESNQRRGHIIEALRQRHIMSVFHYLPLHCSVMGGRHGYKQGDLPISEQAGDRLLRLPLYNSMTGAEQQYVIRALTKIL